MKQIIAITFLIITVGFLSTSYAKGFNNELESQAISDAKGASKQEKLAYMNCYPLPWSARQKCRVNSKENPSKIYKINGNYAMPYDSEAEKQGFVTFLRGQGHICNSIKKAPIFEKNKQSYKVICDGSNSYFLSFDYINKSWKIEE